MRSAAHERKILGMPLMYRKILVGYDDSDQSKDALALGKQLADASRAELVVAGVFQFDPIWREYDPHFHEEEAEYARKIEAAAKSVGAEPEAFPSSSPARGLHQLAEEIDADLILVGSAHHGRVGQALAGSVGVALLNGSPCAVGIAPLGYRDRAREGIAAVVVGVDGSPESRLAFEAASELASATGAKLRLVAVAETPLMGTGKGGGEGWHELKEAIEQSTRERLAEARDSVPEGIEVEATLVSGEPAEALVNAARAPGTLLVVGSRGYGPLRRVLLGSVSARLVRSAACPLIVTPRGMHETGGRRLRGKAEAAS
jgi:nucleotide-binding universal stress UspA family protein